VGDEFAKYLAYEAEQKFEIAPALNHTLSDAASGDNDVQQYS
jgi:hypothetical protein